MSPSDAIRWLLGVGVFQDAGDLGNIEANVDGRATFRIIDQQLKIWDIIGRSVCINEKPNHDAGEK